MDKKNVFDKTARDLRRKQIEEIKKIARATLEEINNTEYKIRELQQRKRYLKMDIDDLKDGRLDRIQERQTKDEKAKEASIVLLQRKDIEEVTMSPYYWPYEIYWQNNGELVESNIEINCSIARHNAVGTYSLENGDVVHLR